MADINDIVPSRLVKNANIAGDAKQGQAQPATQSINTEAQKHTPQNAQDKPQQPNPQPQNTASNPSAKLPNSTPNASTPQPPSLPNSPPPPSIVKLTNDAVLLSQKFTSPPQNQAQLPSQASQNLQSPALPNTAQPAVQQPARQSIRDTIGQFIGKLIGKAPPTRQANLQTAPQSSTQANLSIAGKPVPAPINAPILTAQSIASRTPISAVQNASQPSVNHANLQTSPQPPQPNAQSNIRQNHLPQAIASPSAPKQSNVQNNLANNLQSPANPVRTAQPANSATHQPSVPASATAQNLSNLKVTQPIQNNVPNNVQSNLPANNPTQASAPQVNAPQVNSFARTPSALSPSPNTAQNTPQPIAGNQTIATAKTAPTPASQNLATQNLASQNLASNNVSTQNNIQAQSNAQIGARHNNVSNPPQPATANPSVPTAPPDNAEILTSKLRQPVQIPVQNPLPVSSGLTTILSFLSPAIAAPASTPLNSPLAQAQQIFSHISQLLGAHDEALLQQFQRNLPDPRARNFARQLLNYLTQIGKGDSTHFQHLFHNIIIPQKLQADLQQLQHALHQLSAQSVKDKDGDGWKRLYMPLLNDKQINLIRLYVPGFEQGSHQQPAQQQPKNQPAKAQRRFILSFDFSLTGPLEIDVYMEETHLYLIVRSLQSFDHQHQKHIRLLYDNLTRAMGVSGHIAFQQSKHLIDFRNDQQQLNL